MTEQFFLIQGPPLRIRVELRVMVIKEYYTFYKLYDRSLIIRCSIVSYPGYLKYFYVIKHGVILLSSCAASSDFHDSLFLSIGPYHTSFSADLPDDILCPQEASRGKFLLVGQHWQVHMRRSIGERHLGICPCFSNSVPYVSFVVFGCF